MSTGLAISGVTAVLQYYLRELYAANPPFTSTVTVSCLAPDLVQQAFEQNGPEPENQVNLFLHQVTRNPAWRNVDLPSLDGDGKTRLSSPPLALDLHYLLTVYATNFWQAEALLGYALLLLHENPVLVRNDITTALQALSTAPEPYPGNPLTPFLGGAGLADQVEMIKITPETLGREELAWLWTALKADYRPTYPFLVSVVLIEPQRETSLALPVLQRHLAVQPLQPAQLTQLQPPQGQPAAAPTDTVTATGAFLNGVTQVALTNSRYGLQHTVAVTSAGNTSFSFVPDQNSAYPAGVWELTAQFTNAAGNIVQTTSALPLPIAAVLPTQTATVTANSAGNLVTVSFSPSVLQGQNVALALSAIPPLPPFTTSAPAQPFAGPQTAALSFQFAPFPATIPASAALLGRLLVDGVASQVQVNWMAHPPQFTGPMVTL
jgi:Pvc16 N-terminal domain